MITKEDWREYHYGKPEKKKPVTYSLKLGDRFLCTGAYALCVHVSKEHGGLKGNKNLKIVPNYL